MADAFGEAEMEAWRSAMLRPAPKPLDTNGWERLPQVDALQLAAHAAGMVIRLRAEDGSDYTFAINPVAARILAVAIIGDAQEAGWMDEGLNVISPQR
jgi:hypothetical protein